MENSVWKTIPPSRESPISKYSEEWRSKPINHLSHLNFSSLSFALCLRSDDSKKKNVSSNDDDSVNTEDNNLLTKTNCTRKQCQQCQEDIGVFLEKRTTLLKKLDRASKELAHYTEILNKIEIKEQEILSEHTLLEHEAIKLKTFGQEAKLSDKLVELRNEGLELRRQIDLSMIELKRIKSKQTNYLPLMNQSVSMPSFPVTTISTSGTKLFTQKNQNGTRSHTGVYKRSERTNWELAWSCCLNPSINSPGCTLSNNTNQDYLHKNSKHFQTLNIPSSHIISSTSSSGLLSKSRPLNKRPVSAGPRTSTITLNSTF